MLAAAYFLTGDERYADFAAAQLRSWMANNPFLSGIHWTSGIEIGIRLISWVWVRRLLDAWPGVAALFDDNDIFRRQLYHHQEFLARFPSRGSSANNHLIAEEAGQFAASCAFPFFKESAGWREHAATTLVREARLQTFDSGLNRELASDYHMLVLELLLAAAAEGEAAGHPLAPEVWHRICAMIDALAAMVDTVGQPPRQGDGDQGRGLLLDDPDSRLRRAAAGDRRRLLRSLWLVAGRPGRDGLPHARLAASRRSPDAVRGPPASDSEPVPRRRNGDSPRQTPEPPTKSGAAATTAPTASCRSPRMLMRMRFP